MSTIIQHFPSVSAMIAAARTPCRRQKNEELKREKMNKRHDPAWLGIEGNVDTIEALTRSGWKDGAEKLARLTAGLERSIPGAQSARRRKTRGDNGEDVDVDALKRGDFDKMWLSSHRAIRRGIASIQIIVDVGASCNHSADVLFWRGAAATALSAILARAGYSVEIIGAYANKVGKTEHVQCVSWVAKSRGEIANPSRIAATVCLSGFFRTFGFAHVFHACDKLRINGTNGVGYAQPAEEHYPVNPRMTTLHTGNKIDSESSARHWIESTIKLLQAARG